jgi:hypothetical protein
MTRPPLTPQAVFDRLHEIPLPTEREAYLDQVCAGAADLRRQVEALLHAHADAASSLGKPPPLLPVTGPYLPRADTPPEPAPVDAPTTDHITDTRDQSRDGTVDRIGPYRLLQ